MNKNTPMVRSLRRTALLLGTLALAGAAQATDVGVSIQISQPGVYGRIDLGRYPQPAVVVGQPVLIAPPRAVVPVQPVYLWVPPGHQKNWAKHCGQYNACGVPVYFVQDQWYRNNVMAQPRYEERRGDDRRGGRDWDDDRGPGRGHGNGHGRGHRD